MGETKTGEPNPENPAGSSSGARLTGPVVRRWANPPQASGAMTSWPKAAMVGGLAKSQNQT
jgi:hypothetical protein